MGAAYCAHRGKAGDDPDRGISAREFAKQDAISPEVSHGLSKDLKCPEVIWPHMYGHR